MGAVDEWYRLEISGRINGGYIVRADRDRGGGFAIAAHAWFIHPPSVRAGKGRVGPDAAPRVAEALERCGFWEMSPDDERWGFDGVFYHFVAAVGDRSHRVVRWSPFGPELADFRALCDLLSEFGRVGAGLEW